MTSGTILNNLVGLYPYSTGTHAYHYPQPSYGAYYHPTYSYYAHQDSYYYYHPSHHQRYSNFYWYPSGNAVISSVFLSKRIIRNSTVDHGMTGDGWWYQSLGQQMDEYRIKIPISGSKTVADGYKHFTYSVLFFPTCKLTCTFICNVPRILHNDRKNQKFCGTLVQCVY